MHEGHRQRMLQRLKNGGNDLQDHELLEILLFYSIPRKNTNEIAHELLSSFGSLKAVFQVEDYRQYLCVNGVGESTATFLASIGQCFKRANQPEKKRAPVFNYAAFIDEIKDRYNDLDEEVVEFYKLDKKNRIGFVKTITSNETSQARFLPNELNNFLVTLKPYAIVVAHNHLCDDFNPSPQDDNFTRDVMMFCKMSNVLFYDHVIVSPAGYYSYFLTGKLDKMKAQYAPEKMPSLSEL